MTIIKAERSSAQPGATFENALGLIPHGTACFAPNWRQCEAINSWQEGQSENWDNPATFDNPFLCSCNDGDCNWLPIADGTEKVCFFKFLRFSTPI